jgi:hypothetical protein
MNTIIFTNARDEYLINEWIAHYFLLGFCTVCVYDHLSVTPIRQTASIFLESAAYGHRLIVKRIDNPVIGKAHLIKNSFHYAKENNYDWAMYVDADEFLYLRDFDNISQYIESFLLKKPDTLQIGFPWVMFGSNGLDTDPSHNILESFTKSQQYNHDHIKTICRVQLIDTENATVPVPHFLKYNTFPEHSYLSDFNNFKPEKSWIFEKTYPALSLDAYIAHYQYQSYDTYIRRKVARGRDDLPRCNYPSLTKTEFHSRCNDITNIFPRDKYAKNIQELLAQLESQTSIP